MAITWDDFHGANAAYVLDLYDRFLANPSSVDPATRAFFEQAGAPAAAPEPAAAPRPVTPYDAALVAAAGSLATGIREYGHRAAHLDPLGTPPPGDTEMVPETHGLSEAALQALPASAVGGPAAAGAANA